VQQSINLEEQLSDKPTILKERVKIKNQKQNVPIDVRDIIFQSGPLIALLLLGGYLSCATPHFLTVSNLINVARQSSITAILAVGQTMVILSAGIDISVGAIVALAGSTAAVLMVLRVYLWPTEFLWGCYSSALHGYVGWFY